MIDWAELTLFLYITARISGFVLFNPVLGRRNIPGIFRSGFVLVLSVFVISFTAPVTVRTPGSIIEMAFCILLEMALGYLLGLVMNFFFYIPQLAGHSVGKQYAAQHADDAAVFRRRRPPHPAAADADFP